MSKKTKNNTTTVYFLHLVDGTNLLTRLNKIEKDRLYLRNPLEVKSNASLGAVLLQRYNIFNNDDDVNIVLRENSIMCQYEVDEVITESYDSYLNNTKDKVALSPISNSDNLSPSTEKIKEMYNKIKEQSSSSDKKEIDWASLRKNVTRTDTE